MITAICPGSYDPVTYGHLDVIKRAAGIFDRVVVGVVRDPHHKGTMFTVEERVQFLRDELAEDVYLDVVEVTEGDTEELDPFLDAEGRLLVVRVADDPDHDVVEDACGARDHVQMAVRDRVVAARADRDNGVRGAHACSKSVSRAEP